MVRLGILIPSLVALSCVLTTFTGNSYGQDDANQNPFGQAGIEIDADNVLRLKQTDARLREAQLQAARKNHGKAEVAALRKVSLNRYEKAVAKALENKGLDDMMVGVAGLTRIEYVMYLPGSQDIVIAGPAEELTTDVNGYLVGMKSGRPALRLDDLVIALRAYGPSDRKADYISCSIDPTQEGLARMQAYFNQFNGQMPANIDGRTIAANMKEALGLQTVSIHGIPTNTRFAQTLVEADYRMKLIGIGLEQPAIPLRSWVSRAKNSSGSSSALQRWWFEADYSNVSVSPDGNVLKLEGNGVKLIGEAEHVDRSGKRSQTGKEGDRASLAFTKEFTEKFDKLADSTPVFAAMRNLFDVSIAAAYIRQQNMYSMANWDLGVFANEDGLAVQQASSPLQVETAVNAIVAPGKFMAPIGGGVMIEARDVINQDRVSTNDELTKTQEVAAAPADLSADQWWWD